MRFCDHCGKKVKYGRWVLAWRFCPPCYREWRKKAKELTKDLRKMQIRLGTKRYGDVVIRALDCFAFAQVYDRKVIVKEGNT